MHPTLILLGAYILVTVVLQVMGFAISRAVDQIAPALSISCAHLHWHGQLPCA